MSRSVHQFDPSALRRAREAAGFTQAAVADQLGQARTNYIAYERGRRGPTAPTLLQLAQIVGVDPHELTTREPSEATLRDLREWAGLGQRDVAAELGREETSWGRIERGQKPLSTANATQIADLFGVPEEEVLEAAERTRGDTHG